VSEAQGGRLVVHAHFYQPAREDPFTGIVPRERAAAPAHDWNERIAADCYRPNAERGTFGRISFDIGPTLARWLERADPGTYGAIVAQGSASGDAMAQPYHHTILPLASLRDRRTEIRWGLRDYELRFGRRPVGAWLPETAVDLATLRLLAAEGIEYTILAPWQAAAPHIDTRHPYRVELGRGASIDVAFYDGPISGAVSFDPGTTADADRFALDVVAPRLQAAPSPTVADALVVLTTDGELYGHHRLFRDLFLERLVAPAGVSDRPFEVASLSAVLRRGSRAPFPATRIVERTSWSCHHGVARWGWECPDAADGRWKAPLRAAFERLASAVDAVTVRELTAIPSRDPAGLDAWDVRDAYVDVVDGREEPDAFADRFVGPGTPADTRHRLLGLLEAQRWRLAMFASDAWFWDDPTRPETRQALRQAARSVRLVDEVAGTRLEARLVEDLSLFSSPSTGADGSEIYRRALREVGQPAEGPGSPR
jgi:hypothetical protein